MLAVILRIEASVLNVRSNSSLHAVHQIFQLLHVDTRLAQASKSPFSWGEGASPQESREGGGFFGLKCFCRNSLKHVFNTD